MSVNTNVSAMSALQGLARLNLELLQNHARLTTGLKVASVKENAGAWEMAQQGRSLHGAMGVIQDAVARGQSIVDVAIGAGESVVDILTQMKSVALSASDTSLSTQARALLSEEFRNLRDRIKRVTDEANFGGVNLIKANAQNIEVLAWYQPDAVLITTPPAGGGGGGGGNGNGNGNGGNGNGNGNGNGGNGGGGGGNGVGNGKKRLTGGTNPAGTVRYDVELTVITVQAQSLALGGPNVTLTAASSFTSAQEASALMADINTSLSRAASALGRLGTSANILRGRAQFVTKADDAVQASIGAIVDADLARESARREALLTRRQLVQNALQIANAGPAGVLGLFAMQSGRTLAFA